MKVSYSKGLHAAGLLFMTLQLLVQVFEYVVNSLSVPDFFLENWACVGGYVLLGAIFLKKKRVTTDLILTVIGIMAWVVQIVQNFEKFPEEIISGFMFSAFGILGAVLVLVALLFDIGADAQKDKDS